MLLASTVVLLCFVLSAAENPCERDCGKRSDYGEDRFGLRNCRKERNAECRDYRKEVAKEKREEAAEARRARKEGRTTTRKPTQEERMADEGEMGEPHMNENDERVEEPHKNEEEGRGDDEEPITARRRTTTKPVMHEERTPNEILLDCCHERDDIPDTCYKYCTYEKVTRSGIVAGFLDKNCPNQHLQKIFGCASQLQDNSVCCEKNKVPAGLCFQMCPRGVETFKIDKSFISCLKYVNTYGECFEKNVTNAVAEGRQLGW